MIKTRNDRSAELFIVKTRGLQVARWKVRVICEVCSLCCGTLQNLPHTVAPSIRERRCRPLATAFHICGWGVFARGVGLSMRLFAKCFTARPKIACPSGRGRIPVGLVYRANKGCPLFRTVVSIAVFSPRLCNRGGPQCHRAGAWLREVGSLFPFSCFLLDPSFVKKGNFGGHDEKTGLGSQAAYWVHFANLTSCRPGPSQKSQKNVFG